MKDSNATVSQLALLQQKLHSAKLALDEVNEDRNAKLQTLLQFIGHLSLACKGQNLELDNKLAKLRHNLSTFERIDEALPELVDVERLLKGQYHHVMVQLEESRAGLAQVVRQIQRVNSAPEKLKKKLTISSRIFPNLSIQFGNIFLKLNKLLAFTKPYYSSNLANQKSLKFYLSTDNLPMN